MKRHLIIVVVALLAGGTHAQEKEKGFQNFLESKDWKLTAAFSFAPGFQTENTQSINLQGYAGFLKDRIEVRGDLTYMVDQIGDRPRFSMNHQLYFGAFYHFSDKNLQPYLGFQPGAALSQSSEYGTYNSSTGEVEYKITVNPIATGAAGIAYYSEKFFYMYAESRYIFGKHKSNTYPVHLDELRFAFGLGLFL